MPLHDFLDIGFGFVVAPDPFWVDNHRRPVFAEVQAALQVDADVLLRRSDHGSPTHVVAQNLGIFAAAAAAPVGRRALVGAAEDVYVVNWCGVVELPALDVRRLGKCWINRHANFRVKN